MSLRLYCHFRICRPYRGAEAATTRRAPELAEGVLHGAGGVEALGQKHYAVEEEEGRQAVDDVLKILNSERKEFLVIKNNQDKS